MQRGRDLGGPARLNIANSVIDHNYRAHAHYGGGIISSGTVNLTDSTVAFNTAGTRRRDPDERRRRDATLRARHRRPQRDDHGHRPTAGGLVTPGLADRRQHLDAGHGQRPVVLPLNCGSTAAGDGDPTAGGNIEDPTTAAELRRGHRTRSSRPRSTRRCSRRRCRSPATSPAIDIADCGGRTLRPTRGVARPQGARCDAGAVRAAATAAADADADPDADADAHADARRRRRWSTRPSWSSEVKGTVKVKLPGHHSLRSTSTPRAASRSARRSTPRRASSSSRRSRSAAPARDRPLLRRHLQGHASRGGITDLTLDRALAPCPKRARERRRQEAQEPQAVGRRQGRVPHQRQVQRRHRPRHEMARPGLVRRHATRVTQGSVTVRDNVKQDDHRARRQALHRAAASAELDGRSLRPLQVRLGSLLVRGEGEVMTEALDTDVPGGGGCGAGARPCRERRHLHRHGHGDIAGICDGTSCASIRQALGVRRARPPGATRSYRPGGQHQLTLGAAAVDSRRHAQRRRRAHHAIVATARRAACSRSAPRPSRSPASRSAAARRPTGGFHGGTLRNQGGTVTLDRVRVTGGTASSGGGVANRNGSMLIEHSLIDHNSARWAAGTAAGSSTSAATPARRPADRPQHDDRVQHRAPRGRADQLRQRRGTP